MVTWAKKLNVPIGHRKVKNFRTPEVSSMSLLETVGTDKEILCSDKRKGGDSPKKHDKKSYRYSGKKRHDVSKEDKDKMDAYNLADQDLTPKIIRRSNDKNFASLTDNNRKLVGKRLSS